MKYGFIFTFFIGLLHSCTPNRIAQPEDYNAYLTEDHLNTTVENNVKEIAFWQNKLREDPQSFVNLSELGYNYLGLFKLKGETQHLKKGDSLLQSAAAKLNFTDPDLLQGLSQLAITQHQFNKAALYNEDAFQKGGSPYIHALLSFDVGMELGQYQTAKSKLNNLKDPASFDALIRKAKYQDQIGDLEGAIQLMEEAFAKVAQSNKAHLYCWALSNLGDMYGHAGRIEDAYRAYLQVLEKDPSYLYALKGIAWIAYSHDKNTAEAKRILNFLAGISLMPDIYLTLAEMAEYEKDVPLKKKYLQQFLTMVADSAYSHMYNKYLIELYTEEFTDLEKAEQIAAMEVANRATPETYSWLAWVYFHQGNKELAYQLFRAHVKGRTFEPEVLLKGAYIMQAAGNNREASNYFEECLASKFEIGPLKSSQVQAALNK